MKKAPKLPPKLAPFDKPLRCTACGTAYATHRAIDTGWLCRACWEARP